MIINLLRFAVLFLFLFVFEGLVLDAKPMKGEKIYLEQQSDTTLADKYFKTIGAIANSQPDSALKLIYESKLLLDTTVHFRRFSYLIQTEVSIHNRKGNFEKALILSRQLIEIAVRNNNPVLLTKATLLLGATYYFLDAHEKAISAFLKTYDLALSTSQPTLQIKALINAASSYNRIEKFAEAESLYAKGLALSRKVNDRGEEATTLLNIANVKGSQKNYGLSIQYLDSAAVLFKELNHTFAMALIQSNLAFANKELRNYDLALQQNQEAVRLRQQLGDKKGLAQSYNIFAEIYLELADWDKARNYADKAIKLARDLSSLKNVERAFKTKYLINQRTKQFDKALSYHEKYIAVRDSIIDIQESQEQKWSEILLSSTKDEEEAQLEVRLKESKRRLFILSGLLVVVLLVCFWLFFQFSLRNNRISKNLSDSEDKLYDYKARFKELQHENDSLKSQLSKHDKNSSEIGALKNQRAKLLEKIDEIYKRENGDSQPNWSKFHLLFASIYPNFVDDLKSKFPDLTTNEIRLACLIKINLTQPDIAGLLNITTESVRKARYRMYKKMDMETDQSMVDFLLAM